jgi:hypothetical protein
MEKKFSVIGIIVCVLYFLSVGLFLVTGTSPALTVWELMTVISGPVVLLTLLGFARYLSIPDIQEKLMLVFMGCTCALTGAAHIVNITVTRRLMAEGIDVPAYYQIGQWPSVEMAVDYLAWGFFAGLAFLVIGLPIRDANRSKKVFKIISLICSVLCLVGFFGAVFINENLWYAAPMGYGLGFIVLCVMVLTMKNRE